MCGTCTMGLCCELSLYFILSILGPSLFVCFFYGPWYAVNNSWLNYTVDTSKLDRSATTLNSTLLYIKYPMLVFDRMQYLNKLCFNSTTRAFCEYPSYVSVAVHCPLTSCDRAE